MRTPEIKITVTEPANDFEDADRMLVRSFEAPHEPVTCHPAHAKPTTATSTAVQVEGFLRGAGYDLPVMLGYERRGKELKDALAAASNAGARCNTATKERDRWKAYAIWLERRCQSNNLSINTPKLKEIRPEPREED